jgi:molybdopterin synthase catalytic subunit
MTVTPTIRVQNENFDLQSEIEAQTAGRRNIGAVVTFTGLCRDEDGSLDALELEHYPGMAEAEMRRIGHEAIERFSLLGLAAIHRYGKIAPGENIVLVIACAPHRQAAFDGANFVMDYLKTAAPFWKKEHLADGSTGGWVSAKDADDAARDKWQVIPSVNDRNLLRGTGDVHPARSIPESDAPASVEDCDMAGERNPAHPKDRALLPPGRR